ncbi:MAG TPA: hypothetical protein VD886_10085 [Herpetosiphonaceae bacterium]|nr:hypothetical protein [Herpetosiphonaceae bacterium]
MYDAPPPSSQPTSRLRRYWIWLILPFVALTRYFFAFGMLAFMNALSVLGTFGVFGMFVSLIFVAFLAYATLRLAVWLYIRLRRFTYGLVPFVAIIGVAVWIGWVLFPVACDTHESWIDTPNKRCDCRGLTVRFYPANVSDGAETEFCIGREIF